MRAGVGLLASVAIAGSAVALVASERARTSASTSAPVAPASELAAQEYNTDYRPGFTFVRLRYDMGLNSFGGFSREPPWAHDYPIAERNLAKIIQETTLIAPYLEGSNIYATDDPDLFRYPVAYMSEPGYWRPSDSEVEGLREWLLKGGFLIFDDFGGRDWFQFEQSMKRVLPEHEIHPVDVTHPIFDSFFRIESLAFDEQGTSIAGGVGRTRGRGRGMYRGTPEYYGITENNEPGGRLMVIVNYNNDIGDMWEWSDQGVLPIRLTNDAYQLGVNYIVYAMTH